MITSLSYDLPKKMRSGESLKIQRHYLTMWWVRVKPLPWWPLRWNFAVWGWQVNRWLWCRITWSVSGVKSLSSYTPMPIFWWPPKKTLKPPTVSALLRVSPMAIGMRSLWPTHHSVRLRYRQSLKPSLSSSKSKRLPPPLKMPKKMRANHRTHGTLLTAGLNLKKSTRNWPQVKTATPTICIGTSWALMP